MPAPEAGRWAARNQAADAVFRAMACEAFDRQGQAVFIALCHFSALGREPGVARVGSSSLRRAARLSTRGVWRGLAWLAKEGLVSSAPTEPGGVNEYRLAYGELRKRANGARKRP